MKKILVIFGTRPEAIKMAPLVKELEKNTEKFNTVVCITAQHRQMLDRALELFEIRPKYDLDVMRAGQDLYDLTSRVLTGLRNVLTREMPDLVLVHGDTTTTFAASLAAFYQKIPVAHVEAGLRTNNPYSPWPEELNRKLVTQISSFHFAPTLNNKNNLLNENICDKKICVTGNTVIDAMLWIMEKARTDSNYEQRITNSISRHYRLHDSRRFILVTGHRRENFGDGFERICFAIKEIALANLDVDIVYPVHLNPNVQRPVNEILGRISNVYLIEPCDYESFVFLMSKCYFVMTDSGGIQEEAPALSKPVLVLRDNTERQEAVDAGVAKLVGTSSSNIIEAATKLLNDEDHYHSMINIKNPYGDGTASKQIVDFLSKV